MPPRAIIIHCLEHAQATLAAAERLSVPVVLYSAEGAAGYGGSAWFRAVIAAAQAAYPRAVYESVLDCGGDAALALAALRDGCRAIVLRGPPALCRKVAAIALASAARLDGGAPGDALDLRHSRDPYGEVAEFLSGAAGSEGKRAR